MNIEHQEEIPESATELRQLSMRAQSLASELSDRIRHFEARLDMVPGKVRVCHVLPDGNLLAFEKLDGRWQLTLATSSASELFMPLVKTGKIPVPSQTKGFCNASPLTKKPLGDKIQATSHLPELLKELASHQQMMVARLKSALETMVQVEARLEKLVQEEGA